MLLNPTFSGETNWAYIDEANSIATVCTSPLAFSSHGTQIAAIGVAGGGNEQIVFSELGSDVHIDRAEIVAFAAKISGGSGSDVAVAVTWGED